MMFQIDSWHRKISTGLHFQNCCHNTAKIQICSKCWICAALWRPFWKWRPLEIFQYRESIRDIIIYPHMKCRWNRTMLNLCSFKIFEMSAIFKMAAKTWHKKWAVKIQHSSISSKFEMWVDNDVPNWFLTLKNFYMSLSLSI
jgi:hypothetical protein